MIDLSYQIVDAAERGAPVRLVRDQGECAFDKIQPGVKHATFNASLAKRPRRHIHVIPTYSESIGGVVEVVPSVSR